MHIAQYAAHHDHCRGCRHLLSGITSSSSSMRRAGRPPFACGPVGVAGDLHSRVAVSSHINNNPGHPEAMPSLQSCAAVAYSHPGHVQKAHGMRCSHVQLIMNGHRYPSAQVHCTVAGPCGMTAAHQKRVAWQTTLAASRHEGQMSKGQMAASHKASCMTSPWLQLQVTVERTCRYRGVVCA